MPSKSRAVRIKDTITELKCLMFAVALSVEGIVGHAYQVKELRIKDTITELKCLMLVVALSVEGTVGLVFQVKSG